MRFGAALLQLLQSGTATHNGHNCAGLASLRIYANLTVARRGLALYPRALFSIAAKRIPAWVSLAATIGQFICP